ncbi:sulfur carrier protein ThiS [Paramuribaculum intestinale]|jgi:thiamine biosynthesis protein ThiS|uniref:sulfur carrier protein ThiS n=1 Tax=Paramuribaculum intestinale TaxID=2094151 RepID=UPI000F466646|nr:sulfur carrier protein ThiS [Paramuribaculum intestinale]ROT13364.1 sulfur carrier protein ThiS [Muribaculaceae bacterium Isolate-105 (HZI)]
MKITINGKTYDMSEASTLQDALEAANVKPQGIATALNNHVVTADMRPKTVLTDGDRVVVITAFYGG